MDLIIRFACDEAGASALEYALLLDAHRHSHHREYHEPSAQASAAVFNIAQ